MIEFFEKAEYCDYHCHLGAMVSAPILFDIANQQGIKLPTNDYHQFEESIEVVDKLPHKKYLDKFSLIQTIQSSPFAIERSVYEAISLSYRKSNITTLEIRFNPMLRNLNKFYNIDSIILHACIGMKKAMMVYPVKCGLIIETDRTFDEERSIILAEKAVKFKNEGVVGFDLSGFTPKDFNYKTFSKAFKIAKKGGLGITCHMGEGDIDTPELVKEMIEDFKPDRIGHGINCIKNNNLLNLIIKKNIVLEICPTSNVMTKTVKDFNDISTIIWNLSLYGVNVTINSDGPVFLDTNVKQEFEKLWLQYIGDNEWLKNIHIKTGNFAFINGFQAKW